MIWAGYGALVIPVVLDIVGGHGRVGHPIIDDRVDADCHRIPRKDL